jgi:hypothetical protein
MVKYKFIVSIVGYMHCDDSENIKELLEDFKQNIYDIDIENTNVLVYTEVNE